MTETLYVAPDGSISLRIFREGGGVNIEEVCRIFRNAKPSSVHPVCPKRRRINELLDGQAFEFVCLIHDLIMQCCA